MDDDDLMARVAAGDHAALRDLFDRHAPWLAVRLRRALPAWVVEDVMQETFVAVWRGACRYRPAGRSGAWIWGIARRQAALWVRVQARQAGGVPVPPARDPGDLVVGADELERAFAVLGTAGVDHRELAKLLLVEDRPVAEVAARLGIPEGTVRSRAHRVRRLLRAALGQEEG
ncbi:MAG TPA: RNA polymerase sigma factor [Candidatus Dormibacteraeota bacterium]|jgi:RNA polymerase sigma-70 factor (ECF subfamily)